MQMILQSGKCEPFIHKSPCSHHPKINRNNAHTYKYIQITKIGHCQKKKKKRLRQKKKKYLTDPFFLSFICAQIVDRKIGSRSRL